MHDNDKEEMDDDSEMAELTKKGWQPETLSVRS